MLHFFASTLAVSGIALFYSRLFRRRFSQTIASAAFSVCILLYLLSILSVPLRASCVLLMGMGLLSLTAFGLSGVRLRKNPLSGMDLFALLLYLACGVFAYTFLYNKLANSWDEFSHWMLTLKNMHHFNGLGLGELSSTEYQSYPPGFQLFECFHLILYPDFKEGNAYMGGAMLLLSTLFAPAFYRLDTTDVSCSAAKPFTGSAWAAGFHRAKKPVSALIRFLILFFSPAAFYASVYNMLYVDASLGILFAHLLWLYFAEDRFDGFFFLSFALCGSVLTLTKGTGVALFSIALAVILADLLIGRRQDMLCLLRKNERHFRIKALAAAAAPLLIFLSWKAYLHIHAIPNFWETGSAITPGRLLLLLTSPQEYQVEAFHTFIRNVRATFNLGVIPVSFARYPVFFFLLCVVCGICTRNLRRSITLGGSLCLSYYAYILSILLTYLFILSPREAVSNASFRRYMNNQTLACWMTVLYLLLNPSILTSQLSRSGEHSAHAAGRRGALLLIPPMLALCFPLLSGGAATQIRQYINAQPERQYAVEARSRQDHLVGLANSMMDEQTRVWYIHQKSTGDHYYMARMQIAPVLTNRKGFRLCSSEETKTSDYAVVKTPQAWSDELAADYDYVYCEFVNDTFASEYGALFESEADISSCALYQVIAPSGDGSLVRLRLVDRL